MSERLSTPDRISLGPDESWFIDDGNAGWSQEEIDKDKEIATAVRAMILAAGYVEETELPLIKEATLDALIADSSLLVVTDHGVQLFPSYQFDADGSVNRHTVAVNKELAVAQDGWGSAGWWIQPNARLAGSVAPIELLRTPAADDLISVAHGLKSDSF